MDGSKRLVSIISGILEKSKDIGPRYLPPLHAYGPKQTVAFTDSSFVRNSDGSSQIARIIFVLGSTAGTSDTPEPSHLLTYFLQVAARPNFRACR
jgi:hypothetical protein